MNDIACMGGVPLNIGDSFYRANRKYTVLEFNPTHVICKCASISGRFEFWRGRFATS